MEKPFADCTDYRKKIREMRLDRRGIARKMGIKPGYLNQMLNGWAVLKMEYEKILKKVLEVK